MSGLSIKSIRESHGSFGIGIRIILILKFITPLKPEREINFEKSGHKYNWNQKIVWIAFPILIASLKFISFAAYNKMFEFKTPTALASRTNRKSQLVSVSPRNLCGIQIRMNFAVVAVIAVSYFIDLFWQIKCNLSLCSQHEHLHILARSKRTIRSHKREREKKKRKPPSRHLKRCCVSKSIEKCKNTINSVWRSVWRHCGVEICIGNFL